MRWYKYKQHLHINIIYYIEIMTFEKYKVILFVLLIVILIYIIYNYQENFLSAHKESQDTKIPENHEEEGKNKKPKKDKKEDNKKDNK